MCLSTSRHNKIEAATTVSTQVWAVFITLIGNTNVHYTHKYEILQQAGTKCNKTEHFYGWNVTLTKSACQLKISVCEHTNLKNEIK